MAPDTFDELAKGMAKTTSRRGMLRVLGLGAFGAAAVAVGLKTDTTPAHADHVCNGVTGTRLLGEGCNEGGGGRNCCAASNQVCVNVGSTGAHRCECAPGLVECNGVCAATCGGTTPTCPTGTSTCTPTGGNAACYPVCTAPQVRNATTCACECTGSCPANQVFDASCNCGCPANLPNECTATETCNAACTGGTTWDPATCTCACGTGQTDCTGQCVNVSTLQGQCAQCGNKVFNAQCCSCENPGQPSGKCKGAICTSTGGTTTCTCENARRTDTF